MIDSGAFNGGMLAKIIESDLVTSPAKSNSPMNATAATHMLGSVELTQPIAEAALDLDHDRTAILFSKEALSKR